MRYQYTVRQPISSDRNLDREGIVLSKHITWQAALRAINREAEAFQRSPYATGNGYLQRYIWDEANQRRM